MLKIENNKYRRMEQKTFFEIPLNKYTEVMIRMEFNKIVMLKLIKASENFKLKLNVEFRENINHLISFRIQLIGFYCNPSTASHKGSKVMRK